MTLLGIPRDGEAFIVVPRLEAPRLDHWRGLLDIHVWDEAQSPYELVTRLVEGAAGGTIGISIEGTVVCRADGGERLNHCRRELTIMS